MEEQTPHRRRPRYRGTHPRNYQERYKEHSPEQYPQEAQHIQAKGNTLAGSHRPIMVDEILAFLDPQPGQLFLDATLGYGGHTKELLSRGARVIGIDTDPIELPKTLDRLRSQGFGPERFEARQLNFSSVKSLLVDFPQGFHGILADLGVSSMQLDNPERGFSHKHDGPLDLRLNPRQGISATQFLQQTAADKLAQILEEFADEPYAYQIANAIKSSGAPITRTSHLTQCIRQRLLKLRPSPAEAETKKAIQRSFMAIRIAVNEEFRSLGRFLNALPECLSDLGKVAILSFHSGEDRRVKKVFAEGHHQGIYSQISPGPQSPGPQERRSNPRSSCAKLRWAIKDHRQD